MKRTNQLRTGNVLGSGHSQSGRAYQRHGIPIVSIPRNEPLPRSRRGKRVQMQIPAGLADLTLGMFKVAGIPGPY